MTASVSVALCTYNGARFLPEQLASLAAQERLPDELVAFDDASQDATLQVLRRFAETAPFPVRIHAQPRRLGSTKNFQDAIAAARGDLIFLCDQDDVWHPQKVARMAAVLESEPDAGGVFCDARLVDAAGRPLGRNVWGSGRLGPRRLRRMEAGRETEVLLRRTAVTGACFAFRASLRDRLLPIPESWVHDAWVALLVASTMRLRPLADALVDYRQHPGAQIGALRRPRGTLPERLRRLPDSFRADAERYRRAAERVEDMAGLRAGARELVLERARNAQARAALPRRRLARVRPVLAELASGRYRRHGRGWVSAAFDLVRPA